MGIALGVIVESAVAILLALTIGYCIVLNRRLKKLHQDRDTLRQMVADLVNATNLANAAVQELKLAARDADGQLTQRLAEADQFRIDFDQHIAAGTALMDRIAKITTAARRDPVVAAEVSADTNKDKVQSALQQLAMRTRIRGSAA